MASCSWVRATIFAACFTLLIMVVAAHEGHEHTPGMAMAPQPEASKGNLVSLTTVPDLPRLPNINHNYV
ncbi:hypothetical protein QQP08_008561 [Theobroma cacao]|nr:hypothetical protein QQP08_008561 [Theobroma cacao]